MEQPIDLELPGQRMTSQRKVLFDIVTESNGHLDAHELFSRAREKEPRISLATVYRNLRLFRDEGLLAERHLAEEHHHYEVRGSAEHYHLVCLGCGAVLEFQSTLTECMKDEVEGQHRFEITNVEIMMEGYCGQCRNATRNNQPEVPQRGD